MKIFSQIKAVASFLLLINLLAFSTLASAKKVPSYKIEVIVFENLALKGWTEELWASDVELPTIANSSSLYTPQTAPLYLRKASKGMAGKASILNKKGYRVIFHEAWTQLAYANKNAKTVAIEGGNPYGSDLLGTVRLYKTRYAHVDIDLTLDRRIPSKVMAAFADNQGLNTEYMPKQWRFKLEESRKIKPEQIHYLDHPLFGVLVKIKKL